MLKGWTWVVWAAVLTLLLGGSMAVIAKRTRTFELKAEKAPPRTFPVLPAGMAYAPDQNPRTARTLTAHAELADQLEVALAEVEPNVLELTVRNSTDRPLTFVRPQDGSMYGWIEPVYELEAYDEHGGRISLPGRCGNVYGTLDEESVVLIRPGEFFKQRIQISWYVPGAHKIRVNYSFDREFLHERASKIAAGEYTIKEGETRRRLNNLFGGQLTSPWVHLKPAQK